MPCTAVSDCVLEHGHDGPCRGYPPCTRCGGTNEIHGLGCMGVGSMRCPYCTPRDAGLMTASEPGLPQHTPWTEGPDDRR